ncbi:MAG: hypothetical protein HEQ23_15700 [Tepidisphaera sp.]
MATTMLVGVTANKSTVDAEPKPPIHMEDDAKTPGSSCHDFLGIVTDGLALAQTVVMGSKGLQVRCATGT